MKIIIIDDDQHFGQILKNLLTNENFQADYVQDSNEGLFKIINGDYDCILLDYLMPNLNGMDLCLKMKSLNINIPTIILSVDTYETSKIDSLNSGADYFIQKPFELKELLTTINAALRRPKVKISDIIIIGNTEINTKKFTLTINNENIKISPKEFDLLYVLAKNMNAVLSKQEILDKVWGEEINVFSNTLEVHIQRLRKKLNATKSSISVKNSLNRGYILIDYNEKRDKS